MQIGRWMAACYHPEIVPGAIRHGQARSWLRARAGSRAASARTRASQWPGPTAACGAPVRIDLGEQNRRASERAAAKMGERTVDSFTFYAFIEKHTAAGEHTLGS